MALAVNSRNDLPPDPVTGGEVDRQKKVRYLDMGAQIQSPPHSGVADGRAPALSQMGQPLRAPSVSTTEIAMIWKIHLELPEIEIAANARCRWCVSMADHA